MSEFINNKEHRQKTIREIIRQLHDGKTVEQVKQQFEDAFHDVSASELSEAEGALIAEGLPVEEVQRLCDVHAAVFKGSIAQIHEKEDSTLKAGHPLQILKLENRVIENIIETQVRPYLMGLSDANTLALLTKGIEIASHTIQIGEIKIDSDSELTRFEYFFKKGSIENSPS